MNSSNIKIGIAIMAVPERAKQVTTLLNKLNLNKDCVAWDTNHKGHVYNWWRAIELASKGSPTHILILEDDAQPCVDFLQAVNKIVDRYPDRIVSFFSASRSHEIKPSEVSLVRHDGFSDVAVVYPTSWLDDLKQDFIKNEEKLKHTKWQLGFGADEMRLKLRPANKTWVTSPSLVQHGSPDHSVLGHKIANNLSHSFIGNYQSALSLDWSKV